MIVLNKPAPDLGIQSLKAFVLPSLLLVHLIPEDVLFLIPLIIGQLSMLVAEGAKLLASKLPKHLTNPEFENTAQTAGILHNLGILWLADNLPIETNKALEMVAEENSSLSVSESLRLYAETDYCEIGSWMALQLKLPNILNIAIKYHLTPEYQEASYEIAQLVGLAANMASAIHKQEEGIPTHTQLEKLGLNSATQNLIYQQLSVNYEKTHGLAKTLFEGSVS